MGGPIPWTHDEGLVGWGIDGWERVVLAFDNWSGGREGGLLRVYDRVKGRAPHVM